MIIGLTGGIGSGKSEVSKILKKEFEIPIVDADAISEDIVKLGRKGFQAVSQSFGKEVITADGELNREILRQKISQNNDDKRLLNSILHPLIESEVKEQIDHYTRLGEKYVVYDCPLLFEAHQEKYMDLTIVVVCDDEERIRRIVKRDNCSIEAARKMMGIQMPQDQMVLLADVIIDNNGTIDDLNDAVAFVMEKVNQMTSV